MTRSRALVRARLELGSKAYVKHSRTDAPPYRCMIGVVKPLHGYGWEYREVLAHGETWEIAFDRLARRLHGYAVSLLPEEVRALLDAGVLPTQKARLMRAWLEGDRNGEGRP